MRSVLAALFFVCGLLPALAVQPGEMLADPALEARARALSSELRCLVCQNQSIDDSDADLAHDLRVLLRQRLTAGDSDGQVLDFMVARYGDFVLLKPRFSGGTVILWLLPFAVVAAAALALLRKRRVQPSTAESPLTDDEKASLGELT
jgi:cytochrome c-type biogenesis protein CcmH